MQNKILSAVIAVVLVGALYFSFSGTSIEDIIGGDGDEVIEEGAPAMIIKFDALKIESGAIDTTTIELEENENAVITKPPPPATTEVGVPFVEPGSRYYISFSIEVTATPQSPAVIGMDGSVSIIGNSPTGMEYLNGMTTTPSIVEQTVIANTPTDFNFDINGREWFTSQRVVGSTDIGSYMPILGSDIHDSTFTINCVVISQADSTIFGTTTVDIILKVGIGGNIDLLVTGIEIGRAHV